MAVADIDGNGGKEIVISINNSEYKSALVVFTRYGKSLNKYMRSESYFYRGGLNIASWQPNKNPREKVLIVPQIKNSLEQYEIANTCVSQ